MARASYETAIGIAVGSLLIPTSAGISTAFVGGLIIGITTDALLNAKFFNDTTSSASDKLGDFIREFDLENFSEDAYIGTEFATNSIKELLNDAVSTS